MTWGPFISLISLVQTRDCLIYGLRMISGMPTFLRNKINLKKFRVKSIKQSFRERVSTMFYWNSTSKFQHKSC